MKTEKILAELKDNGIVKVSNLISTNDMNILLNIAAKIQDSSKYQEKNVLPQFPAIKNCIESICENIFNASSKYFLTDYCFYLEKNRNSKNWPLALHQDVNFPEYLNWDQMMIEKIRNHGFWIRINLDDNNSKSGALKYVPNSHKLGKISDLEINSSEYQIDYMDTLKGDCILFNPLLLHGSSKMQEGSQRRVFQCMLYLST